MAARRAKISQEMKDNIILGVAVAAAVGFIQLNNTLKAQEETLKGHMEDCSKKSAMLVRVVIGVGTMVLGELLLKGLTFFHFQS